MSGATPGPDEPPAHVRELADRRAEARAARRFDDSDRLREDIAAAGWTVRDGPDGAQLSPRPAYDVVASVQDLPDRRASPDTRRCTVGLLVDGWPDDLRTCVQALLRHAPDDVVVLLLENGSTDAGAVVHELAAAHPGRIEEWHVERPAGWGTARQALLDADEATVHVLMDLSTVLEGDALTPLLAALDDPSVIGAGWRGVRVQDGWREFADAATGDVEALLGYLFAVRRSAALQVPLPPARSYRNADLEWSFLLREAGGRLVVPPQELPVRQDRHRGYHDTDPVVRDRESKKTYDRFLRRFRGREELRLPRRAD
jgi:hypothetical protein